MSEQLRFQQGAVVANGVRLHYLDWGGRGTPLVFLAGFGNTPHFFDSLARQLTDRFRVVGLTRRGHGASERPETGYDIATLARDIVGFLDALGFERAAFVGHSFAGSEMVELATAHADRVDKLVFLDALYEYEKSDLELFGANPLRVSVPPPETFESADAYSRDFVARYPAYRGLRTPTWDEALSHALERAPDGRFQERLRPPLADQMGSSRFEYRADWRRIRCPVLALYAFPGETWSVPADAAPGVQDAVRAYTARMDREYRGRNIAHARRDIRTLHLVELRDTSHFCFLDREDAVVEALRGFL